MATETGRRKEAALFAIKTSSMQSSTRRPPISLHLASRSRRFISPTTGLPPLRRPPRVRPRGGGEERMATATDEGANGHRQATAKSPPNPASGRPPAPPRDVREETISIWRGLEIGFFSRFFTTHSSPLILAKRLHVRPSPTKINGSSPPRACLAACWPPRWPWPRRG